MVLATLFSSADRIPHLRQASTEDDMHCSRMFAALHAFAVFPVELSNTKGERGHSLYIPECSAYPLRRGMEFEDRSSLLPEWISDPPAPRIPEERSE